MRIIYGNLWDFVDKVDALCITTNRFVKKDGSAVMGKGCALEAKIKYSGIEYKLGGKITQGEKSTTIIWKKPIILSFPVKPDELVCKSPETDIVSHMRSKFTIGEKIPGWACKADLKIIEESAMNLLSITNKEKWNKIILPFPGCGAGELTWKEVELTINRYLDNRFICITKTKIN